MTLGLIVLLCALVLTALGVVAPLLEHLRISSLGAAAFLLLIFCAWFVLPRQSAFVTALPGLLYLVKLRWWRGRALAVLAALAGGIASFLVLLAVDSFRESGMLAGLCSALAACALGRFRRGRMFAGLVAPAVTMMLSVLAESLFSMVVYGGDSALFDLTVGSLVFTTAVSGALEMVKRRRLE